MRDDWTVVIEDEVRLPVPADRPAGGTTAGGRAWVLPALVIIGLMLAGAGLFLFPVIAPLVMGRLEQARRVRDLDGVRRWQPWALLTAIGDCLASIWRACGVAGAIFILAIVHTPEQMPAPSVRLLATFGLLPLAVLVLVALKCLLPLLLVMMVGSESRARAEGRAPGADRRRGRRRVLLIARALGWSGVLALFAVLQGAAPWKFW